MSLHAARLAAALIAAVALAIPAWGKPGAEDLRALRRGINVTGWFRFASQDSPYATRGYLSASALKTVAEAGFTFLRIPLDPQFALDPARRQVLTAELARVQRSGLAVVPVLASAEWRLESRPEDRATFLAAWRALAPALARLPARLTFPEVLNEPVFAGDVAGWAALQSAALAVIRSSLPASTVILAGNDWSSLAGLCAVSPPADPAVVYTFHFYDPAELTSLAAYRADLDHAAFARLPFPMRDAEACRARADGPDRATGSLVAFVCAQGWDSEAIEQRFAAAAKWSRQTGVPVLLGEFGASAELNAPARLAWTGAVRRAAEENGIGWALWGLDDVMGFNLPRPPPAHPRLDPALLQALGLRSNIAK